MPGPTLRACLALAFACLLGIGCKSPICRVGKENGKAEMKAWMALGPQPIGWFQDWQRFEDYRHKKIYIHGPDLSLLCEADCQEVRKNLQRALETHLFQKLRANPQYEWVTDPAQADFELRLKIARVKEHHDIEYVSILPPTNHYVYWFKLTNTRTSTTAFWDHGYGFGFDEMDHQRTFQRLLTHLDTFKDDRG
jgi:hypothetical protein